MSDDDARKLLVLLNEYMCEHFDGKDLTVADLVDDLVMSQDVTDDVSDTIRKMWGN